jgi:hypothetical protein
MTDLIVWGSAEWCHAKLGKAFDDLLSENRCALCERIVTGKLRHDCDPKLQRMGLPIEEYHRGWVCGGCDSLLKWMDLIGEKKVFAYVDREPWDEPPRYPEDGCCELCGNDPGRKLHRDHDHEFEDRGLTLEYSQRGFLCDGCNTKKLARIDAIGVEKLREYIGRARKKLVSCGYKIPDSE